MGLLYLFSSFIWLAIGGLMALAIRWQLAWPWSDLPIFGRLFFSAEGGQISPEFYTMLFTMHGTIMIFFVVIPLLTGAFGSYLIPLMIGSQRMAFPRLNALSYWLMWPAFLFLVISFLTPGYGPAAGWTAYAPLSVLWDAAPGSQWGQTLWLIALGFTSLSSLLNAINAITTIVTQRTSGMTLFRLPMTIWSLLITHVLQGLTLPVLMLAAMMQLLDRHGGTVFFLPLQDGATGLSTGGGQPLLWQHLFWFYAHPAVYVMVLPAMGIVSDILSCFSKKPLFGYRPMVYSMCGICGMGLLVWGHHMFVSGLNPYIGTAFMISTMLIALPSGVKVFNWLATLWGGKLELKTPMLFCLAFVLMFIVGGLSGILMASNAADEFVHDTYYIVAHFHYVLFGGTMMAVFGGFYFWFPKVFGRQLNERAGKLHFLLSFLFVNGTFFPMHILGWRGFPRRYADPYALEQFADLLPLNQLITYCAFATAAVQLILLGNIAYSLLRGPRAANNPWGGNTLEWLAASPPALENFPVLPEVKRGPYEYSHPQHADSHWPQAD